MHHRIRLFQDPRRLPLILVLATLAPSAHGAVIFTGNGMDAEASYTSQAGAGHTNISEQQGSNPAVAGGTSTFSYWRSDFQSDSAVIGTQQATAFATPNQPTLLHVGTNFSSNTSDPGPIVGAINPASSLRATASWNSVEARVTGQNGQAPPSSIRLEFQLNYQSPALVDRYGLGGTFTSIPGYKTQELDLNTGGPIQVNLVEAGTPMQAGESAVQKLADGSLQGNFHYDLGLSATGVSDLFKVGISSYVDTAEVLFNRSGSLNEAMSVSLTGIYLPHGTPISDTDYNVTFESGVYRPSPDLTPVPEPATVIVWFFMAGFGASTLRRRRVA